MTERARRILDTVVGLDPLADLPRWIESELGDSLEARVVKAADKAQMMIKASIYERQQRGQLDDFWANPKNFDDRGISVARELFEALVAARDHSAEW